MSNNIENKEVYLKTGIIVTLVIIVFGAWFWWAKIYTSKSNVFNGMLSNSLSLYGVTKTTKQDGQSGNGGLEQIAQAQFGAQNVVEVKATITQPTQEGNTKVVTQTIATPADSYVRYSEIDVPAQKDKKKPDFAPLINVWGKQIKAEGGDSVFSEAVYGPVLFGNLPSNQRNELTKIMQDKAIYKVDYSKVESKSTDGKSVYSYPVEISTQGYVDLLKRYDEILGLNLMKDLKSDDYAGAASIKVTMDIDKQSHQLVKLDYDGGGRAEDYSGYGIHHEITVPGDAIGRQDLEQKLQKILTDSQQ